MEMTGDWDEDQLVAVVSLKARGVDDATIGQATHLSAFKVKQVLTSEEGAARLAMLSAQRVSHDLGNDNRWDALESGALDMVLEDLRNKSVALEPRELVSIAALANKAKRRHGNAAQTGVVGGAGNGGVAVTLNLPAVLFQHVEQQLSEQRERALVKEISGDEVFERKETARRQRVIQNLQRFTEGGLEPSDVEDVFEIDLKKIGDKPNVETPEFSEMVNSSDDILMGVFADD